MTATQVSVVTPTRNRWRLLRTTLASVLAQDGVDLEYVVVDDGSTDGTSEHLAAAHDPRLRVFRNDTNRGVAHARNRGIGEARSEWVALLDDDDVWSPLKLRKQLDAALERSADFAYAGALQIDEDWTVIRAASPPDPEELPSKLLAGNAIPACCSNILAKTSLLKEVGGFDERLDVLADWDLGLRLAAAARGTAVPDFLIAYLKHRESMISARDRDVFKEFSYLSSKHGVDVRAAGARMSSWAGRGHLESGRRVDAARTYLRGAREYRCATHVLRAGKALIWPNATGPQREPSAAEVPKPDWLELYET